MQRASQALETTLSDQTSATSWATVVIGVPADTVQAELNIFNRQNISEHITKCDEPLTRLSISHVDSASVGVTGPPTRLKQLFEQSDLLRSSRHSALPISGGLCHVRGVYDDEDVQSILEAAGVWERWGSRPVRVPLISPFTGTAFPCADAHHLIEAICTEALTKPLYFDKIAKGVVSQLQNKKPSKAQPVQILHYKSSVLSDKILADVVGKLEHAEVRRQCLIDWATLDASDHSSQSPSSMHNAKLAVVGMSCRMPGGADTTDKFWELLISGVDTHTTVPPHRFDLEAHFDPSGEKENTVGTRFGNFIDNPGYFDAGFFNMSPREVSR